MELIKYLALPLILTLVIETFILVTLGVRKWSIYLLSIGMNIITNVSINCFGYYSNISNAWLFCGIVIALETVVWLIEGMGYNLILHNKKSALHYTLLCNAGSFILGLLFQAILIF